ncbi:ABC transporter ATP-binding protein [Salinirarus marinus]|uniref:ABC transporter ATP-binding protein n=1 Tax=Salinirarus marinus TaxID=3068310 RepID=UPI003C6CBBCC
MLALEDVNAGYGRTPVLHDISMDIQEGEIVSLIGRNGAGKSTLMKTIIGLLSPTSGEISFRGEAVTDDPAERRARRGIGYVPQDKEIFPRLTVHENLKVGRLVNERSDEELFEEMYDYFPILDERRQQRAGTMSGGEQQMLAIARALVGAPDLLLLDEPSEGVQPTIVEEISDAVKEINDDIGTTIFFVEQHLEFTINTTERCYVIETGEIVNELPPDELRDSEVVQQHITV